MSKAAEEAVTVVTVRATGTVVALALRSLLFLVDLGRVPTPTPKHARHRFQWKTIALGTRKGN